MVKSIWDKTDQETSQEIASKNVSEVQKQTIFMLEMMKNLGEAIQHNKSVKVENIVREVFGKVKIERPNWIQELKMDPRSIEKRLDYIASAIIRKEVVRKMDFNRPDWIKELIPKEVKFPDSTDFSKPTVDELKKILIAIENQEKIDEVSIKGPVEIKKPDWFQMPDIASPFVSLATFIKKYFDSAILKVNVQNDLNVKVQNKEFDVNIKNHQKEIAIQNIKELTSRLDLLAAQLRSMGTTGSNGAAGGSSTDMTTVEALLDDIKTNTANINVNIGDVDVNTDTLETLIASTNSKLDTLNNKGFATAENQLTGLSLIPWLKTILTKIAYPSWFDASANVIRNQVQSGTITTVTGLTNIDGYQGKLQIINQNNAAWAQVVRSRIS